MSSDVIEFSVSSGFAKIFVTLLVLGSLLSFCVLLCSSTSFFSSFSSLGCLVGSDVVDSWSFCAVVVARFLVVVKIPGGSFVGLFRCSVVLYGVIMGGGLVKFWFEIFLSCSVSVVLISLFAINEAIEGKLSGL